MEGLKRTAEIKALAVWVNQKPDSAEVSVLAGPMQAMVFHSLIVVRQAVCGKDKYPTFSAKPRLS